jgi:hypothetical protein
MSINYATVRPLDGKIKHTSNETLQFVVSCEGQTIDPGSFSINGEAVIMISSGTITATTDEVLIDNYAGAHSFFRDITCSTTGNGSLESITDYPRLVAMKTDATILRDSLGTESFNSIEGKNANKRIMQGWCKGSVDYGATAGQPFVVKPDICINKSSSGLRGNQVGMIRVYIQLAPDAEALFGKQNVAACTYELNNLELRYTWTADDGKRPPVSMEVYESQRDVINSNIANISTMVTKPCNAVHISFLPVSDIQDVTLNQTRRAAFPGKPAGSDVIDPNYGAERLLYAVNDVDNALINFTLENRETILWNYLRSFNLDSKRFNVVNARYTSGMSNSYGVGVSFGGYVDFSNKNFAAQIVSQITEATNVYMFFRAQITL